MLKIFLFALVSSSFFASVAGAAREATLPEGVSTYRDQYFFSAAPTPEKVKAMRALGVQTMIDLREEFEKKDNLAETAKENGMQYLAAPFVKNGPIQREQIQKIEASVPSGKTKTWLFCASGNRAAAWLAIHLNTTKEKDLAGALAEARRVGLTHQQMIEKVETYLKQNR